MTVQVGEVEECIFGFHPILAKWGIKPKIKSRPGQLKPTVHIICFGWITNMTTLALMVFYVGQ
jgi:hypothetical protein